MYLHEHLPEINLHFILLLSSITGFFFPLFKPHMLTDVNLQRSTMTQQRQFVAWLCFTETQLELLMTDSLLVSFASQIQRKWNLSGAEPQALPVPLIWALSC